MKRRIPGLRRLFRMPLSERTVDQDVADEIAFHLDRRSAELEAQGLSATDARQRAEREFGDVAAARAELSSLGLAGVRRSRRTAWVEAVTHEFRLAARGLSRSPGFTTAVVVMLALGIGVNASMFGVTDRLLLSGPPHVADADGLVRVMNESTPPWEGTLRASATMPYADYVVMRDEVASFEGVAAYSFGSFSLLGRGPDAHELRVVGVTPSYFPVLGVKPALGRFFVAREGAVPSGEAVVVLSHALWRTRFGSDPQVIGTDVELDNRLFTVIGVAPRGFHGIDLEPVGAWVPMSSTMTATQVDQWHTVRWMNWIRIVARLAPEASRDVAASQATAAYLAAEEYQERYRDDPTARIVLGSVIAARAPAVGSGTPQRSGRVALWLLGVSGVVLVIACVNVANLMLARGIRRRREIGVRLAMGIGRLRLAGHVLTETVLIAVMAGVLGVILAHWGGQLARVVLIPDFDWAGSPVDRRVLLFAGVAATASMLVAGLIPALQASRVDVRQLLSLGGRGETYRRSRLRSGLVAIQATLSVILLVGAGLFVRSLHNARTVPLGYEPDRVAYVQWHTAGQEWSTERLHQLYDASLERVRALPMVEAAGLSMTGPMWGSMGGGIHIPGRDSVPPPPGMAGYMFDAVSPGYFDALGTRVVRGRAFADGDGPGGVPVAIVTESLARWLWPGEDALGRCLVHVVGDDPPCREVVGIVETLRYRTVEEDPPAHIFFIPLAQAPPYRARALTIQTRGDPEPALPSVRLALHQLEAELPPIQATLLRHRIDPQLQPWRLGASLFSAFGILALVLAGLGLYGVVAYDVAQRRRELGVRRALGARTRNVMALVLGDAYRVIAIGLVIGLAVAAWAAPRMETLLFGVTPRDGAVLGVVAAVLLVVGGAAAFFPGLRAARVEPAEALRDD
jgi:putative ABC transport system permease protein